MLLLCVLPPHTYTYIPGLPVPRGGERRHAHESVTRQELLDSATPEQLEALGLTPRKKKASCDDELADLLGGMAIGQGRVAELDTYGSR